MFSSVLVVLDVRDEIGFKYPSIVFPSILVSGVCIEAEGKSPVEYQHVHYYIKTVYKCTRHVRNELRIVLYLDIHMGHDKNQYIPILVYSRSTQRCINVHVRFNVRHKRIIDTCYG